MKAKEFFRGIGMIFLYIILNIAATQIENSVIRGLLVLIMLYAIVRPPIIEDYKKFKKDYKKNLKKMFIIWLISITLLLISNYIIVKYVNTGIAPNEKANRDLLKANPISSYITMILLAPLTEELIFRESFKDAFKNKYVYAIVTGLLFGFMHVVFSSTKVTDLLYIIPYGTLGIGLGLIYKETDDNILSSYFTHAFHNLISILLITL